MASKYSRDPPSGAGLPGP